MKQGGILDTETVQENIDGLENLTLVNERIAAEKAEETLFARLAMESEQNPAANAAMVEIMETPKDKIKILKTYFTPQDPEMSPEQQAMMAQAGLPAAGAPGAEPPGPPEPVSTVMSRVETGRQAEAGIQTAGRI